MATAEQNRDFVDAIMPAYPLDDVIAWISNNLDPSDVFGEESLSAWAIECGFWRDSDEK